MPLEVLERLPWNVDRELVENLAMVEDISDYKTWFMDVRSGEKVAYLTDEQSADASDPWSLVLKQLAYKRTPNAAETLRAALDEVGA